MQGYMLHYKNDAAVMEQWSEFQGKIIMEVFKYKMPVILLDKATPKENSLSGYLRM